MAFFENLPNQFSDGTSGTDNGHSRHDAFFLRTYAVMITDSAGRFKMRHFPSLSFPHRIVNLLKLFLTCGKRFQDRGIEKPLRFVKH